MTPPSRPTASFEPVCSGCQCVLISVWTRLLPVRSFTAASNASALAARPPSIISARFFTCIAITLQPAPWKRKRPPRSVAEDLWSGLRHYSGISVTQGGAAQRCDAGGLKDVEFQRLENAGARTDSQLLECVYV